ncbi:MAG: RtcB family protein [Bacteroidales bacterium]|nr:RtcB family protein [Bacteroidales bacterium]
MKLRGKELLKIGFPDGELISLIINTVRKNFKRTDKAEVLHLLEDLLKNPSRYKNDPRLRVITEHLKESGKEKRQGSVETPTIHLEKRVRDYVIYGRENIEQEALDQMESAMRLPITVKGALMADAHSGYGLPIGGVLATSNAVIPFGVGMDIGCRMCLSVYSINPSVINEKKGYLKEILLNNTRFGKKEYFHEKKEHEIMERQEFSRFKYLKSLKDKAYEQLGTSGSGNHFVEFGIVELPEDNDFKIDGGKYMAVLSHSGSRNFGANIAQHYTRVAKSMCKLPKGAVNLAWLDLDTEEGYEYWNAMSLAGDYARANHQIIHRKISEALGETPVLKVENHHNFAWKEKLDDGNEVIVHRKGATPAHINIYGVIPGSMTLPAFIVKGKGNQMSIHSASHGAGRQMSRSRAKQQFSEKVLRDTLAKAGVELIGGGTDEAPMAYKDIYTVMEYQKDLVETVGVFYPKIVRMSSD